MKKQFFLFISTLLCCGLAAQNFVPEKNGGWKHISPGKDGVFTVGKMRVLSIFEFKVDPGAVYRLSGKFRSNGTAPQNKLLFFGAEAYDAKGRVIGSPHVNIFKGTETVLAKDLAKKDKFIYVRDASKWNTKTRAGVVTFGIKDNLADLPNGTHSPNIVKIEKQKDIWKILIWMEAKQ